MIPEISRKLHHAFILPKASNVSVHIACKGNIFSETVEWQNMMNFNKPTKSIKYFIVHGSFI